MSAISDVLKNLRGISNRLDNLYFIRRNQERAVQVEQYKALLHDPVVKKYISDVRKMMSVKNVYGGEYCRIGDPINSGGYIMLDDFKDKNIFYSFGIAADVSWDSYPAEVLDKKVYMYDHTIEALPYQNKNFIWKKQGICGENEMGKNEKLKALSEILRENGHDSENDMILKMDVEGAEWDVFSTFDADELKRFDQIALELHWFWDLNNKDRILKSLENLNRHHQIIHVHGNSFGIAVPMEGYNMPDIIEATWVRKEGREFCTSNHFFPTSLDARNDVNYPEIIMGYWN